MGERLANKKGANEIAPFLFALRVKPLALKYSHLQKLLTAGVIC